MADDVDLANEVTNRQTENALRRIRETMSKDTKGPKHCQECGDDIPDARRKLGFKLCISCAEESERKKSLYAGD